MYVVCQLIRARLLASAWAGCRLHVSRPEVCRGVVAWLAAARTRSFELLRYPNLQSRRGTLPCRRVSFVMAATSCCADRWSLDHKARRHVVTFCYSYYRRSRRLEELLLRQGENHGQNGDGLLLLLSHLPPGHRQSSTCNGFCDNIILFTAVTILPPLRASRFTIPHPTRNVMASWTSLRSPLLHIGRTGRESAPYLKRCQSCRSRRGNSNGIAMMRDSSLLQKNSLVAPSRCHGSR